MKILPILMNTDMVRALLEGRKTVTRRLIKPQPVLAMMTKAGLMTSDGPFPSEDGLVWNWTVVRTPWEVGDVMYVRETWNFAYTLDRNEQPIAGTGRFYYAADDRAPFAYWVTSDREYKDEMPWRPSIHMPKEAARIFLRVTGVRVERLQDVTEDGAVAEGIAPKGGNFALDDFESLWNTTIKPADLDKYGWDANPWVWGIEFERVDKPEGWMK